MAAWTLDALPLEQMSLTDKFALIEKVWDSLIRKDGDFISPAWHGDVLQARLRAVQSGTASFHPLDEVKQRLRKPSQI